MHSIRLVKLAISLVLFLTLVIVPTTIHAEVGPNNDVNYSTDVIYQIVTDRFNDGDPTNNPTGDNYSADCSNLQLYCGGDWQGIIKKIQDGYLTNMGVTALWISQPVENVYAVHTDGYASYHGYWARDYKKTNPYFGDFSDFDQLIDVAHRNGMKVIIDFTPNHSSPALETKPGYVENGAIYDNGNLLASYSNDPLNLFHHYGGTDFSSFEDSIYRNLYDLTDYNLNNQVINHYLKESIKLWLDKGIDGIRVDAVKHMPMGFQKSLMDEIYNHRPVFTFGEWFLGTNEVDSKNHYFANESGMSLLDFRFGQTLREVLRDGTDDWYGFNNMIQSTASAYDEVIDQVTFIDNHDMGRFSVEGNATRQTDLALAVLLTSRGVPTIYYGTEQYLTGSGDPTNRKPMYSFDKSTTAYKIISKLAPLRKQNPALAYGNTTERWVNSDVYIYERKFGNNVVVTAINRGYTDYEITGLQTSLPGGPYSDQLGQLLGGNEIHVNSSGSVSSFNLGAREAAVWEYTETSTTPQIGHVGPVMGQVGHTITINGEGFGATEGQVHLGSESATIVTWNDKEVQFTVPEVMAGKYDVTLTTADGAISNKFSNFEVLTNEQVSVRFVVNNANTELGSNIYLVGNVHELGNWDPNKAIGPFFNQVVYKYPNWYYDVSVPADTNLEFKFIKKDSVGNVVWESGINHVYRTPASGTSTISVDWQ
ncbi:alpha-amylase family glycosyl hydrolase [Radiobacillus deserti]|uniref:Cyclomaltodextrin glucanotransferase n=1 Tax=Radiobacillus deserti TaxID=2594883 RepID=A0A516KG33_9BACI|nr:alpha-amylase family glycosyl hydrolase [Radiobacillus deserti]QDP40372.1 alpha-amylase [Radiobacillus deserti]